MSEMAGAFFKEGFMKKFKKYIIPIILLMLIVRFIYYSFFSIQNITGEELKTTYASSDNRYIVEFYLNNGNATVDFAVLGVCFDKETKKTRNFYWEYHQSNTQAFWFSDYEISINGKILDVRFDEYDYRDDDIWTEQWS